MANRGAFCANIGDPIYAIEVTYGNGDTAIKTYPSLPGLTSGLTAALGDIGRFPGESWWPQSVRTFVCHPTWEDFTP